MIVCGAARAGCRRSRVSPSSLDHPRRWRCSRHRACGSCCRRRLHARPCPRRGDGKGYAGPDPACFRCQGLRAARRRGHPWQTASDRSPSTPGCARWVLGPILQGEYVDRTRPSAVRALIWGPNEQRPLREGEAPSSAASSIAREARCAPLKHATSSRALRRYENNIRIADLESEVRFTSSKGARTHSNVRAVG